jgi:valyl-tRNA synthetase
MLTRLSKTVELVRTQLDTYKFNESASTLYNFVWNEFCDWGIEYSKADKDSISELGAIFKETLKLVSPFMPFIADYLYHKLSGSNVEDDGTKSVMIMEFPNHNILARDESVEKDFATIENIITTIRRAKVTIDMGNSKIPKAYIKLDDNSFDKNSSISFIQKLSKCESVEFVDTKQDNAITEVGDGFVVYVPRGEIDMKPIIDKLTKQKEKLQKEIDKLDNMLSNERFVANAPEQVIATNKEALSSAKEKMSKIENELEAIS